MRKLLAALSLVTTISNAHTAFASDRFFGLLVGESSWLEQAETVAQRTDFENNTRVMPLVGSGAVQALQDFSKLENIDALIIPADSLLYAKSQKLFDAKIANPTELSRLNVVLLTKKSNLNLTKLAGKRIATGPAQSAGFATGELIFNALEIPFLRVPKEGKAAITAVQDGTADAALVLLNDKDASNLKFKVLDLPLPSQLSETYQTANLKVQGKTVETISVALQLITLEPSQNSAVKKFNAMLSNSNAPTIVPTGGKP